ncbi:MAG: serine hydrolase domain-containing protein [Bacteroidota bacterium]
MKNQIYLLTQILLFTGLLNVSWAQKSPKIGAEEISAIVKDYASNDQFHGGVLIAQHGEVKFEFARGVNADGEVNALGSQFELCSLGKMFTGMLIAHLVHEGKLAYEDTFVSYLPSYECHPQQQEISIHHLLTHSSGIPDIFSQDVIKKVVSTQKMSIEEYFDHYAQEPNSTVFFSSEKPAFKSGKKFSYSNSGYLLLGLVIEEVTGLTYAQAVEKYILTPFGMSETHSGNAYGGGKSTMRDMIKFQRGIHKHKLLDELAFTEVIEPRSKNGKDFYYGYGFEIDLAHPLKIVSHKGGNATTKVEFMFTPQADYMGIVYANNPLKGYNEFHQLRQMIRLQLGQE